MRIRAASKARWNRRTRSTIMSSKLCATTSRGRAGGAAIPFGSATPSTATARTSTRCSSRWRGRRESRRVSKLASPCPAGTEGTIPGYHCWAEFYVNGVGWVPVDISEAWKDPKKHDYFFGSLDANRVQFTVGRDLTLQPKQDGDPLNYFIYPYVEVDGKPFEGIEKKFSYREEPVTAGVTGRGAGR